MKNRRSIKYKNNNNVELNVRFDVQSRHRGRARKVYATLTKGARYDCSGLHSAAGNRTGVTSSQVHRFDHSATAPRMYQYQSNV